MTAVHISRGVLNDDQRAELVFGGDLLIFADVAGLRAFRDRIDELVTDRFGATDPQTAQFRFERAEYLDAIRDLQQAVRSDRVAHERLLAALEDTGVALSDAYWDWIYLRVLPDGDEYAAKGTGWHRDTWASNVGAQTNWWTPIYPITAGRTISFGVAHWSEPVPNTSQEWDPRAVRRLRRDQAADGSTVQLIPEPLSPLRHVPELRVVIEPDDLLCFSGAHLHRTVANTSGRARFSVEVRTVHRKDIELGRGAPNVDGHAPRTQFRWFRHVLNDTALADASARSPHS
jgi:hypothetical protein